MNTLDITPEKRRLQHEYDELKKKFLLESRFSRFLMA